MTTQELPIEAVRIDGGTQTRSIIDDAVVTEYAEAVEQGAALPPVVVFYDGQHYWLADGFHRHKAYLKAGRNVIKCDVRQGTQRDAILYSVGANHQHGLRRTNDDKRRAVLTLLSDKEWSQWSVHDIAKQCKVSDYLVRSIRTELKVDGSQSKTSDCDDRANLGGGERSNGLESEATEPESRPSSTSKKPLEPGKVIGRDGKHYPMSKPILCERCARIGGGVQDCQACKDAKANKSKPAEPAPIEPTKPAAKNADPKQEAADAYCSELNKLIKALDDANREAERLQQNHLGYAVHWDSIKQQIKSARGSVAIGRPKFKCPYCKGAGEDDGRTCKPCKGHGWVGKATYHHAPAELKDGSAEGDE